jgi:phage gp29-like protein
MKKQSSNKNASLPAAARRINRLKNASSLTSATLEQTNPLRGLTLARAVSLMEAALRGEHTLPQWTLWHIEQTDPDLFALILRRTSALEEMDWDIKIVDQKPVLAAKQAAELRAAYERIDNLSEAIEELSLAFCRGFSILQFENSDSAPGLHLGAYKPWNIVRHGLDGDFYFNPEARAVSWHSLPAENRIDPANHIIYTPRVNLMRIALYKFIRMNLSQKDWDAFIEIYGLPSCFIIMPPNIPEGKETQYETSAKEAAEGANGALPNGSEVKFAAEPRGVNPFRDHLKFLQEQLILAGTGGLLTMLAQPTGIGEGASGAHEETFKTIARGEARKISEIFQKQFDAKILAEKFPGEPVLAYFEIASKEEQDVGEIIDHASKLFQAGYTMDAAQLAEKTGYKIEFSNFRFQNMNSAPAFSQGQNPGTGFSRVSASNRRAVSRAGLPARGTLCRIQNAAEEPLIGEALAEIRLHCAEAQDAVLQPLRAVLEEILSSSDTDLKSQISNLKSKLPALLKKINADPATAKIIEKIISESLMRGFIS